MEAVIFLSIIIALFSILVSCFAIRRVKKQIAEITDALIDVKNGNGNRRILSATAILLYYFEGMTDVEIGKMFNTSRSTIQYRRTSSFELLKKYLEEHADEWNEW